jgi:hypothetical protein
MKDGTDMEAFNEENQSRKQNEVVLKHYARKAYGGVNVYIHIFFTSALVGDEWSA